MRSFHRICLIVTFLFVLFLLIGLPSNVTNESSNNTRKLTMYPNVSLDQTSDEGYISTFQTSTSLFVQSSQLNIGIQSGTSTLTLNDDLYQQIESQYINTMTASSKSTYTYGDNGDNDETATQTTNDVYDESDPELIAIPNYVSYETNVSGTTTDFSNAQARDTNFETLSESNSTIGSIPTQLGEQHDSDGNIYAVWFADENTGNVISVGRNEEIHVTSWDTTTVSGTITSVKLYVNYTVDSGYTGSNRIEYNTTSTSWTPTIIKPENSYTTYVVNSTTLTDVDNINKLQNLNVRFISDDKPSSGSDPVTFDKIWLVITIQQPAQYRLNIMQEFSGISAFETINKISIYGNRSADEDITVQAFNSAGTWDDLGQITTTTSIGWNNYTIDPSQHVIDNEYIFIRYIDSVSDSIKSNMTIDATLFETSGYYLDFYYLFQWTGDETNVANISVYDLSNGSQDMSAYIYDHDLDAWISLNFDIDSSVSNHSVILSSNPARFIENSTGEIWIRYAETSSTSSASLNVDYLGVQIHRTIDDGLPAGIWEIEMIYDIQDFSGESSEVTRIIVEDYSNVTAGDTVTVQIFDYNNSQWVSGNPSIVENNKAHHTWNFSTSPSRFISNNPGNIQIRYKYSDTDPASLSVDYLRVIVESAESGNGGGDGGGGGGGGGDGGTTVIRTLSAQISYPEEIEKYVPAEIDVTLTDDEGTFVSNASVTLTFDNETEPYKLEEKEGQYKLLLETDTRETGNYNFTISAEKSGFRDFLSSAFPFGIVVKYPFATSVQHPEFWSEYRSQAVSNPISVLLDPTLYILPAIAATLITLQVTTFASIDPRKLRSIYIFTREGQGIHYRTFFEEKGSIDSQLMSAALSGIVSLVMEATRSEKPMRTIDIETFEIFLDYGRFITVATFVGKRIFYKRKIRRGQRKLIDNFEKRYSHILSNWDGDISHFYELNQLVFDAFDFKLTKALSTLIAGAAKVQLDLVSLYSSQEKFHMSSRALWKAYDLYAKIGNPRAQFIVERWKALEKAYLADYIGSTSLIRTKILSMFFGILDFIRTAGLLKILYKIRSIIYPEISKELYYFIPPEQLTERTDEGI